MRLRCEAKPKNQPSHVLADVSRLDEICFEADERIKTAGSWYWLIRDYRNRPIAFAGMRACKHSSNEGLAVLTRAAVLPRHRGKGLQKRLIKARIAMARREGFKEVVTFTMGWNLASANSLIACGFRLYTPTSKWAGGDALYFRYTL